MARYTKKEKARLLSEYQCSQESKSDFCKRNSIGSTTLYRWQKRKEQIKSEPLRLLPVIGSEPNHQELIELKFPKGVKLQFSQAISAHYVADIIKAVAW